MKQAAFAFVQPFSDVHIVRNRPALQAAVRNKKKPATARCKLGLDREGRLSDLATSEFVTKSS